MRKSLFATLALSCALAGGAEAADGQADPRAGGPAAAPSTALLGNVERNQVLRALVRYSIKQDDQTPTPQQLPKPKEEK
jgi:hypothetical protein